MFQIPDTAVYESLGLIVNKRADRVSQRHHRRRCWRLKARHDTKQVGNQNEQPQRYQERRETLAVVADYVLALAFDKSVNALKNVLQATRTFNRKPRAYQNQ